MPRPPVLDDPVRLEVQIERADMLVLRARAGNGHVAPLVRTLIENYVQELGK